MTGPDHGKGHNAQTAQSTQESSIDYVYRLLTLITDGHPAPRELAGYARATLEGAFRVLMASSDWPARP